MRVHGKMRGSAHRQTAGESGQVSLLAATPTRCFSCLIDLRGPTGASVWPECSLCCRTLDAAC